MRKMLAIGMLGIFLLAVAAVQPVTASHQKSFVNKISSSKELAEKILKDPKILKEMSILPILKVLLVILAIWATILTVALAAAFILTWIMSIFIPQPYP
ncbi:MAG: hypothetical protein DRN25_05710 [Thermoplasmata archaeon]|nr:MAG: hypothetical protein DRN25_05710 [Thermoplasmata archaeon]